MAWATDAEVLALTGTVVSAAQVVQAQGIVTLYAGVEEGVEDLEIRDLRMLNLATVYQAAWMVAQIDVPSRTEVTSIDQDGVKLVPTDADALLLAPLARRALASLSWRRRTGTVCVQSGDIRFRKLEDYRDAWLKDETSDRWIPSTGGWAS